MKFIDNDRIMVVFKMVDGEYKNEEGNDYSSKISFAVFDTVAENFSLFGRQNYWFGTATTFI